MRRPCGAQPARLSSTRHRLSGCRRFVAIALIGALSFAGARRAHASDALATAIHRLVDSGGYTALRVRRLASLQDEIRHIYEKRHFAPLWLEGDRPTPQAQAVVDVLVVARDEGLDPADYDAMRMADVTERLRAAAPVNSNELALYDIELTAATLRYANDTFHGAIDPERAGLKLALKSARFDDEQAVVDIATTDAMATLHALTPPFPAYQYLKDALLQTRHLVAQPDLPVAPALPRLRPGDAHEDLPALRRYLTVLGDLPADAAAPADPILYDEALAQAVAHFQRRHGIEEDSIIGPGTLRQLRVPLSQRVVQLRLGLERLRWLPREFPKRTIIVNLPEFRLRAFDGDMAHAALTMNVVVGSANQKTETPLLSAEMRNVIFRPRWNVPDSITQKEMLPTIRRNPAYMRKQNLELIGSDGTVLEPTEENLELLAVREARLRQKSGDRNSLGLVKFELPNRQSIYFHDTPSKGLFQRVRRDFSHGCIRVADPVTLAEFALAGVDHWTRARIEDAMRNTDPTRRHVRVAMASPITVYLLYTTATAGEDGQVIFLDDIYGHDAKLRPLLTGN
jgi:murein L,D-transpeptidase YcbB/YkuD